MRNEEWRIYMGKETISKNLKRLLKSNAKTQTDLARDLGISESTVSTWVNGVKYPRRDKVEIIADYLKVMPSDITDDKSDFESAHPIPVKMIPVVAKISAGLPIYSEENIVDYTYVVQTLLKNGKEYFGLIVEGDSMNNEFNEGDIVIVEKDSHVESGQIGVVMINGYNATVKRINYQKDMIVLLPESNNPIHEPQVYNKDDEVTIIGRVVSMSRHY